MPLPKEKDSYTYADLLEMDSEEHIELIYGEPVMMPTPSIRHQRISRKLMRQIDSYLDGKKCEVFYAPFAVFPFAKKEDNPRQIDLYVEPDLAVVCDPDKIDDSTGCYGAPDLAIEILSPSNRKHDLVVKHKLYQEAGVREYWIVDPETCSVIVYTLQENGTYSGAIIYPRDAAVPVGVLDNCEIDLTPVFEGM